MYILAYLQELLIREFNFHELNANLLWPGTFSFAEWLVEHKSWIEGRRTIELGRHVHLCIILLEYNCKNMLFLSISPSVTHPRDTSLID